MVFGSPEGSTSIGIRKSFQIPSPFSTTILAVTGPSSGKTIFQKIPYRLQPSISAASSISFGIPLTKLV
ncbi:hypothetical protein D3C75_1228340 [compost metagenome]